MIILLPLAFCAFSASIATQVMRTHYRGFGSPVPHSQGSPLPHHHKEHWTGTDDWSREHVPWIKRDEAPATIPTRTHHRGYGSPVPSGRKDHPLSYLEGNLEASSIAEEVYEIFEEYKEYVEEIENTPSNISGLPTNVPSSLNKRSPDTVTGNPDGPGPVTYDFSGPFGPNTADASATQSIAEEEVISSEDPPFIVRRRPAPKRGLTNFLSKVFPRKRMEGSSWASGKPHDAKQRAPRDRVNIAPRSKSVEGQ